jgi:hypothetical protein
VLSSFETACVGTCEVFVRSYASVHIKYALQPRILRT